MASQHLGTLRNEEKNPEVAAPNEPGWNGALIMSGVAVIIAATFAFLVWYLLSY